MPQPQSRVVDRVQRFGRTSPRGKRRAFTLPLEQVHPVVRIAHRMPGPLNIPTRIISDHELVLIVRGHGTLAINRRRVEFRAGSLLFISPFVSHRFQSDAAHPDNGDAEHVAVHFDFSPDVPPRGGLLQRRRYEVRLTGGLAVPDHVELSSGHRAAAALGATVRSFAADPLAALRASHHLTEAILELLTIRSRDAAASVGASKLQQARVDRATRYVASHLTDALDVAQLAHVAGLSSSRFARVFHERTGYAPADYVRRARIARARELLTDVDLSVKEVARMTGFADVYTFSKVFRRVDGLSPTEYRAAAIAGR